MYLAVSLLSSTKKVAAFLLSVPIQANTAGWPVKTKEKPMTEIPVIELHASDGSTIRLKLETPKPCSNCGAIPELLIDKDTLTAGVHCPKCKAGTGYSVLGVAITDWNDKN